MSFESSTCIVVSVGYSLALFFFFYTLCIMLGGLFCMFWELSLKGPKLDRPRFSDFLWFLRRVLY